MTNPLTIAEVVTSLGISEKSVRRMLKAGQLHEHGRDDRGRILITPDSISAAAEQLAERHHDTAMPAASPIVLASQTTSLDRHIERLTTMLEDRDARINKLIEEVTELKTAQRYLPAPGRVQELEQEVTNLRAQLAARDRPMTDQPSQPIRKGWIARLLGRDQDTDR